MMRFKLRDTDIEIREGRAGDEALLLSFIRSMAEYEKLEVEATEEILRNSLFGENPAARTLLAFVDGMPAAYAIYFFSFASMTGRRGLWLDDLFVDPEFRRKGLARAMMAYLAREAERSGCARFEWVVLDWNRPAIGLYSDLGARILDDWKICRIDGEELTRLAMETEQHG